MAADQLITVMVMALPPVGSVLLLCGVDHIKIKFLYLTAVDDNVALAGDVTLPP
jgi:hypothetical protein